MTRHRTYQLAHRCRIGRRIKKVIITIKNITNGEAVRRRLKLKCSKSCKRKCVLNETEYIEIR